MISLNLTIYQCLEMALRLIVACACGAIVGYEREKNNKNAGVRTHIIVCCSSALIMIVSKYGFNDLVSGNELLFGTKGADPARLAAQVISGVSFIGAGVIFHNKNSTKGLTTASGLWAIAGVGLSIGAGMYEIGIFATLLIAFIHTILSKLSTTIGDSSYIVDIEIVAANTESVRKKISDYMSKNAINIRDESMKFEKKRVTFMYTIKMDHYPDIDEIGKIFDDNDDIKAISVSLMS